MQESEFGKMNVHDFCSFTSWIFNNLGHFRQLEVMLPSLQENTVMNHNIYCLSFA